MEFHTCYFVVDQNYDILFIEANVEGNCHDFGLTISYAMTKTLIK